MQTKRGRTIKKFFDAVLFREIWAAMIVPFKHMFLKEVTFQYPREKRIIPDAHRGALGLLRYDKGDGKIGEERCVGCDLCEAACPSHCIKVVSAPADPRSPNPLIRVATEFYIDITKCVFCGYCVEACPVNALAMTKEYEYSTTNKRDLIFDKKKLYDIGERFLEDSKKYLFAHNQEVDDALWEQYRYRFPAPTVEAQAQYQTLTPPREEEPVAVAATTKPAAAAKAAAPTPAPASPAAAPKPDKVASLTPTPDSTSTPPEPKA